MDKTDFSYLGRFKITIALSKNIRLERKFLGSFVLVDAHNIYGPLIYLHSRICGRDYFNLGV